MEYCSGGELLERICERGHLEDSTAANIMQKFLVLLIICMNKEFRTVVLNQRISCSKTLVLMQKLKL